MRKIKQLRYVSSILLTVLVMTAVSVILTGCKFGDEEGEGIDPFNPDITYSSLTDSRDGKTYRTVEIYGLTWMAENLNYSITGSKCYDNDRGNCDMFGRIYAWDEAVRVCPDGWRLPNDEDWEQLVSFVGTDWNAMQDLKSKSGWSDSYATNRYGFSALPGGYGVPDGTFRYVGSCAVWWIDAEDGASYAAYRHMHVGNPAMDGGYDPKGYYYSVRCVQGERIGPFNPDIDYTTFTDDRDSKSYRSVKIGNQTWMAENLNYNAPRSVCYENTPDNCAKYGRLYYWSTAMGGLRSSSEDAGIVRGICPAGWHLPSDDEWAQLEYDVGGSPTAGKKLKARRGWNSGGNGTNDYGFSALPGGFRWSDGGYHNVGGSGYWWNSTSDGEGYFWAKYMRSYHDYVERSREPDDESWLASIRCVRD